MKQHSMAYLSAFCVTAISARWWPVLPTFSWLIMSAILVAVIHIPSINKVVCSLLRRDGGNRLLDIGYMAKSEFSALAIYLFSGMLSGMIWMASVGHWYLCWQLPELKIQQDVILTGRIVEIRLFDAHQQALLAVEKLDNQRFYGNALLYIDNKIGLFQPHQYVQFHSKLKPASTLVNPATDFRSSLVAKGVTVTGQVLQSPDTQLITPARSWHYVWAQRLISMDYSRWTVALLTGNRQQLQPTDWALLRITGTAHLFSISGMHVGMVALWTSFFVGILVAILLLVRGKNYNAFNIQPHVLIIALFVSGGYATLANWQVPVSRAWICLGILSLVSLSGGNWTWLQRYLVIVATCILFFPLSVFGSSFYLSAGAVALLILFTWRFKPSATTWLGRFKYVCKLQFALSLMLVPITAVFFNNVSFLVAPINLIAIPWITMVVPVGLVGLVLTALTGTPNIMLDIADVALVALVGMLNGVQPFMLSYEKLAFSPHSVVCGFLALLLAGSLPFPYRRRCCLVLALPLLSYLVPPSSRDWHLHIFDVGQGNAMLISKGAQGILIDTGPSYETSDAYTRVIKPALAQLGIAQFDRIMVTHGDDDHAGGLFSAKTDRLKTNGLAPAVMTNIDACTQGNDFNWRELDFHIMWPPRLNHVDGNGYSCVFTVTDGEHTVLFPGDINKSVEYELLYNKAYLKSDVLVAPHHGSNTSSSGAFIYAVAPRYTVFSTGYYHRWRLPHPTVIARYQQYGTQMVNTSHIGYTRFTFNNKEIATYTQGAGIHKRWYDGRWYRPSTTIKHH